MDKSSCFGEGFPRGRIILSSYMVLNFPLLYLSMYNDRYLCMIDMCVAWSFLSLVSKEAFFFLVTAKCRASQLYKRSHLMPHFPTFPILKTFALQWCYHIIGCFHSSPRDKCLNCFFGSSISFSKLTLKTETHFCILNYFKAEALWPFYNTLVAGHTKRPSESHEEVKGLVGRGGRVGVRGGAA